MRVKGHKQIEFFFKKFLIPAKFHLIIRSNRAMKKAYSGKEEIEMKLLNTLCDPNKNSLDVGVFKGVYTYWMQKYSEHVYAFEPNPYSYNEIHRALTGNVTLYNSALSNKSGRGELKLPIRVGKTSSNYNEKYEMGLGTLNEKLYYNKFKVFNVETTAIDKLGLNSLGFIKIDVEGHELEVLKGAKETINKYKPNMIIEIEEQHSKNPIQFSLDQIINLGYMGYFIVRKSKKVFNIKNFEKKKYHILGGAEYINNFIFLHKDNEINAKLSETFEPY